MQTGFSSMRTHDQFWDDYKAMKRKINGMAILEYYDARNVFEMQGSKGIEAVHSCLLDRVVQHHTNGDNSPSASLNLEGLVYNCWSYHDEKGSSGGDLLWFVKQMEGLERYDALGFLSRFIEDSDAPSKSPVDIINEIYKKHEDENAPIRSFSSIMLEPWLMIHPYMTDDRGFNEETLQRYAIGYDDEYEQIVIPHFWKGKLVGYQKRRQDNPTWPTTPLVDKNGLYIPKYKNSKDFPKDRTLYNYDTVRERKIRSVIVVESVMSVLRAESWFDEGHTEWGNVLCTFGSKVKPQQIEHLAEFEEITLMMDNDPAGWSSTVKLYEKLKNSCIVNVVTMPKNKDLGDLGLSEAIMVKNDAKPGSLEIFKFQKLLKELKKP